MTMGVKALFVDTNILIYSTNPASPFHQAAITVLKEAHDQGIEPTISTQILREFYGFATRPGEHGPKLPTLSPAAKRHNNNQETVDGGRSAP